ncbi:hypothetical protein ACFPN2_22435 [Steroidobacter flavus]|uniref:Uncharacterized protein n=1 Tax=Steroidobacter flavus TaxID=1842136 RepID=A0ABV8SWF2_9GAMM
MSMIDAIALTVHAVLASVALVQLVALLLSGRAEGIIAGVLFAVFILPLVPAIRRALIARNITASLQPRTGTQAFLATVAGGSALVLLALACVGVPGYDPTLAGENRLGHLLFACVLLWIAGVLREWRARGSSPRDGYDPH